MGKAGRNETRRTGANFLNGIVVAVLVAGCVGPMLAGDSRIWTVILSIFASAGAHLTAVCLVGGLED